MCTLCAGIPDSRYIRAETCMFLIKLPQYSNQEIMTERLVYAINCREDRIASFLQIGNPGGMLHKDIDYVLTVLLEIFARI